MSDQSSTKRTSPYFSIVIPAYNEEEHIGSCLRSIFNSNYDSTKYEVVVVDNGSQDRSYEIALNFGRARVFELPRGNVGAVRNYGAAQARGQILVFIDADCLLDKNWLNRAEKLIEDRPTCAYGGGVKLPTNATWIEKYWLLENRGQPTLPKHLIGASTMLSKTVFSKLGGFNELITSGEDTDLHNRLIYKNVPVLIEHTLNITHLGNAKTSFQFVQRQIWHSENYLNKFLYSLKDPIFIITLIFIFLSSLLIIQSIFSPDYIKFLIILALCTLPPALLSCKRMYRARYFTLMPNVLFKIYFIDLLYLTGRAIGLLRGAVRKSK